MILTGLIFLPLLALPTLFMLKKNFQIKLFYALVAFVHLVFSLGLFTKHGYLFDGVILEEQMNLFQGVGLDYTVSLSARAVLILLVVDFLYLIFGTLSIRDGGRKEAVILTISHSLVLTSLMSTNLLMSVFAVFIFSFSCLVAAGRTQQSSRFSSHCLFFGGASLLGACLVLGILYESVYGYSNLNLNALVEMRTPFVKGSLYSTQFVLFGLYQIGLVCFALSNAISCFNTGLRAEIFRPALGFGLSLYISTVYTASLFPEASKFYLPSAQNQKVILISATFLAVFFLFVKKSIKLFLERPEHV
jgi:hypothetical protein